MDTREEFDIEKALYFEDSSDCSNKLIEEFQFLTPESYTDTAATYNPGPGTIQQDSQSSEVNQIQKCIILKPVVSTPSTKTNLKYTVIKSFTATSRGLSNKRLSVPHSFETGPIARKIPVSLPKMILDVVQPKSNGSDSPASSTETDRTTIFEVKKFPPHVQNVIDALIIKPPTNLVDPNSNVYSIPVVEPVIKNTNVHNIVGVNSNHHINSVPKSNEASTTVSWTSNMNSRPNDCQDSYRTPVFQEPYRTQVFQEPYRTPVFQEPYRKPVFQEPYRKPVFQEPYKTPVFQEPYKTPVFQDTANIKTEVSNTAEQILPKLVDTNMVQPKTVTTPAKPKKVIPAITGTKVIANVTNPIRARVKNTYEIEKRLNNMYSKFAIDSRNTSGSTKFLPNNSKMTRFQKLPVTYNTGSKNATFSPKIFTYNNTNSPSKTTSKMASRDNYEMILPLNAEKQLLLKNDKCTLDVPFNIDEHNQSNVFGICEAAINGSQSSLTSADVSHSVFSNETPLDVTKNCAIKEGNTNTTKEVREVMDENVSCNRETVAEPNVGVVEKENEVGYSENGFTEGKEMVSKLEREGEGGREVVEGNAAMEEILVKKGGEVIQDERKENDEGVSDNSLRPYIKEYDELNIKEELDHDLDADMDRTSNVDDSNQLSEKQDKLSEDEAEIWSCDFCDEKFEDKVDLKIHVRKHSKDKDFLCHICNRSFRHESTLKNHYMRIHTLKQKKYKCNGCEQSFVQWSLLKEHRQTTHPSEEKHQCNMCAKIFPNKTALKAHVQRHTDTRRYPCQFCEKVYKDRAGLNVHLVVHTQVSKFSCMLCDRKFGKKNLLTDHMKIFHLKQKDHLCEVCNRAFSTKNTLKRHSWIHTGEKNYICEICGRPFRQKVALTVHMKVHNKQPRVKNVFNSNASMMSFSNNGFNTLPEYNVIKFENGLVETKFNLVDSS